MLPTAPPPRRRDGSVSSNGAAGGGDVPVPPPIGLGGSDPANGTVGERPSFGLGRNRFQVDLIDVDLVDSGMQEDMSDDTPVGASDDLSGDTDGESQPEPDSITLDDLLAADEEENFLDDVDYERDAAADPDDEALEDEVPSHVTGDDEIESVNANTISAGGADGEGGSSGDEAWGVEVPDPVEDALLPVTEQQAPEEVVAARDVRHTAPAADITTPAGKYPFGVVSHSYHGDRVYNVDDGSPLSDSPGRVYGGAKYRKDRKAKPVGDVLFAQPRDIFWLEQAARYDFLSAEELAGFARVYSRLPRKEVAAWAKATPASVQTRMRQLVKAGLFDSFIVPSGVGGAVVYRPNVRSLSMYGASSFTPRKPSSEELMHTSAVARLGLLFESQDMLRERYYVMAEGEIRAFVKFGEAVFVERGTEHWEEDEKVDLSNRAQFLVEKPGGFIYDYDSAGRPFVKGGYFRPDLVLLGRDGSRVAVEVERTPKPNVAAYQDKFSGYLKSGFSGVQYVCFSRAVADAVRRGIQATPGAERLVAVDLFPDSLMPLPLLRVERVTATKFPGVKRGRGRPAAGNLDWVPADPNTSNNPAVIDDSGTVDE